MDFLLFTVLYAGGVGLFLFIMLCGEAAAFRGTPVAGLHCLITSGPCIATECAPSLASFPCEQGVSSISVYSGQMVKLSAK